MHTNVWMPGWMCSGRRRERWQKRHHVDTNCLAAQCKVHRLSLALTQVERAEDGDHWSIEDVVKPKEMLLRHLGGCTASRAGGTDGDGAADKSLNAMEAIAGR